MLSALHITVRFSGRQSCWFPFRWWVTRSVKAEMAADLDGETPRRPTVVTLRAEELHRDAQMVGRLGERPEAPVRMRDTQGTERPQRSATSRSLMPAAERATVAGWR